MAGFSDIKPVPPVWPLRPPDRTGSKKKAPERRPDPARRKPDQAPPADDDKPHIDEYA